jgi:hypothetical protein
VPALLVPEQAHHLAPAGGRGRPGGRERLGEAAALERRDAALEAQAGGGEDQALAAPVLRFHEFSHGDDGRGLGASHQTGWTALAAHLLERVAWTRAGDGSHHG